MLHTHDLGKSTGTQILTGSENIVEGDIGQGSCNNPLPYPSFSNSHGMSRHKNRSTEIVTWLLTWMADVMAEFQHFLKLWNEEKWSWWKPRQRSVTTVQEKSFKMMLMMHMGFCRPEIASQMKVILRRNYALVEKAGKTFHLQLGYCAFRVTSCFVIAAILRTE